MEPTQDPGGTEGEGCHLAGRPSGPHDSPRLDDLSIEEFVAGLVARIEAEVAGLALPIDPDMEHVTPAAIAAMVETRAKALIASADRAMDLSRQRPEAMLPVVEYYLKRLRILDIHLQTFELVAEYFRRRFGPADQ